VEFKHLFRSLNRSLVGGGSLVPAIYFSTAVFADAVPVLRGWLPLVA